MLKYCSVSRINLLYELRHVAREVGGLAEARRMPTEIRRWWLEQIRKEKEQVAGEANSRPR